MEFFVCRECGERRLMREYVDVMEYSGICYGCYRRKPRHVCVDFDGVLAEYDGWRGPMELGRPMEGARGFLRELVRMGFRVVVHTTRDPQVVRGWLREHGMLRLVHEVTKEKVPALAYIDDRAICFRGSYDEMLEVLRSFRPYWKQEGEGHV